MRKNIAVLVTLLILVSFALYGCGKDGGDSAASASPSAAIETDTGGSVGGTEETTDDRMDPAETEKPVEEAPAQGEPVPTFTVDWPSDALPEGFPNLGKVTKVMDFRGYGNEIYIQWNIISEEELKNIVDALNEYLDYDHEWQGYYYSDGLKYKEGTEEEILNVEIRYDSSASGEVGENSDPQLTIEISGEGLPEA